MRAAAHPERRKLLRVMDASAPSGALVAPTGARVLRLLADADDRRVLLAADGIVLEQSRPPADGVDAQLTALAALELLASHRADAGGRAPGVAVPSVRWVATSDRAGVVVAVTALPGIAIDRALARAPAPLVREVAARLLGAVATWLDAGVAHRPLLASHVLVDVGADAGLGVGGAVGVGRDGAADGDAADTATGTGGQRAESERMGIRSAETGAAVRVGIVGWRGARVAPNSPDLGAGRRAWFAGTDESVALIASLAPLLSRIAGADEIMHRTAAVLVHAPDRARLDDAIALLDAPPAHGARNPSMPRGRSSPSPSDTPSPSHGGTERPRRPRQNHQQHEESQDGQQTQAPQQPQADGHRHELEQPHELRQLQQRPQAQAPTERPPLLLDEPIPASVLDGRAAALRNARPRRGVWAIAARVVHPDLIDAGERWARRVREAPASARRRALVGIAVFGLVTAGGAVALRVAGGTDPTDPSATTATQSAESTTSTQPTEPNGSTSEPDADGANAMARRPPTEVRRPRRAAIALLEAWWACEQEACRGALEADGAPIATTRPPAVADLRPQRVQRIGELAVVDLRTSGGRATVTLARTDDGWSLRSYASSTPGGADH